MAESQGCKLEWNKVFKEILGGKKPDTNPEVMYPRPSNVPDDMYAFVTDLRKKTEDAQKLMQTNSYYMPKTEPIEYQDSSDEEDDPRGRCPRKNFQEENPLNSPPEPQKKLSRLDEEIEDLFYRARCLKVDDTYASFKSLNDFDGCGIDIWKDRENWTKPWKMVTEKIEYTGEHYINSYNDFDGCGINIWKEKKVWTTPYPKGYGVPPEFVYKCKLKPMKANLKMVTHADILADNARHAKNQTEEWWDKDFYF